MANYDKYDPKAGGFRAPLNAAFSKDDVEKVWGVGLNASGNLVIGGGNSGIVGVLVLTKKMSAGDIVDSMTAGEIVEFDGVPGTIYYADPTTGVVNATSATGKTRIGHTVKAKHLIVRVGGKVA